MKPSKVKRSYDRFNDYSSDLVSSDYNTFDDRVRMLMDFCENDEVLRLVHQQLINHTKVDFDSWYQERKATLGGMVGSGELTFPTNIDDRMAVQYQLIYKIKSGEINAASFARHFFSTGRNLNDAIRAFNEAVCMPLFREMSYKFEDILDELPDNSRQEVSPSIIQFIGNAQNVIQQNTHGSNNTVSAKINDSELERELDKLRDEIRSNVKEENEMRQHLEAVDSAELLLTSSSPKTRPAKTLLNTLPHVGAIASLVASVLQIVS